MTVDELLSGGEVLTVAEESRRQAEKRLCDLVFGGLDCAGVTLLFLPFFGQRAEGMVRAVSLLSLTDAAPYLRAAYWAVAMVMLAWGILTLALQGCEGSFWSGWKSRISLFLNGAGVLLFVLSLQPYAAVFLLVFLAIKVLVLLKKQ